MKRTFLGWQAPALPLAVDRLFDAYADDGLADLSGALVVVPGGRAGRRLKELLVEGAGTRGLRLSPPVITTIGHLPEALFRPDRPVASGAVTRLAWATALRDLPRDRLALLYGRIPVKSAWTEWLALGGAIAALHRDVAQGGYRFSNVVERARSAAARGRTTWDDADRWSVLADAQSRFIELLDAAGRVDADLARVDALESGRVGTGATGPGGAGDVWLIGLSDIPGVARRFLIEVSPRVHALVHAPESEADAFDDLGCVVPARWADRALDLPDTMVHVVDRPMDQADLVVALLARDAAGRGTDEVVIGAPDGDVVPWLQERMAAVELGARDAAGVKLSATGPSRLLAAVAEVAAGRDMAAFAALVRHPDVERWIGEHVEWPAPRDGARFRPGGWLARLDAWIGAHLPSEVPRRWGADGFQGSTGDDGVVVAAVMAGVGRLLGDLGEAGVERPLGEWVAPILEFLDRTYGGADLDPSKLREQRLVRALGALGRAAQSFVDLPPGLEPTCSASVAISILLRETAAERIPETPNRRAVDVLGWLELHLDDSPVTIVTEVNGPYLPESVEGDPFLPDALRSELELADNRLRYARDAYRLTAMRHSTEVLHLIVGRRSSNRDPLRPSRLVFAESDPRRTAHRIRAFYADVAVDDGDRTDQPDVEPVPPTAPASESRFSLPPETVLEFEPPTSLRVTDFGVWLGDPWDWALRRTRRCEPIDDEALEMDGAVFGNLAHAVLERFGTDVAIQSTDAAEIRDALDALLDDEVGKRFGPEAKFARVAVRLQVEQLRARLHAFAAWQAGWRAAGWEVQGVELSTPPGGAPFDVDGEPILLRGKIDRVDHHPASGRWAVFDYKTSDPGDGPEKTHRTGPRDGKSWVDLQLPLYRTLLPHVVDADGDPAFAGVDPAGIEVGYLLLPKSLDAVADAIADWTEADFDDALETAREVVREMRGGRAEFDPGRTPKWLDDRQAALRGAGLLVGEHADEDDSGEEDA